MNPLVLVLLSAIAASGLLLGCQTGPQKIKPLGGIEATLKEAELPPARRPVVAPAQISAALLPPIQLNLGSSQIARSQDKRFDVNVNQAPAREFFMSLVDGTDYNMVIHPDVSGEVSLALKNVTIPEVMQILRDVYGFEFERTSAGYNVLPVRLQSRIFQVNYLNVRRNGNSQMNVSSGQISQTSNNDAAGGGGKTSTSVAASKVTTESSSDFWTELRMSLQTIVGAGVGRSVMVAPQSGIVVVRGMPAELREVENFLRTTQASLHRQVILEAKIIEVSLNDDHQTGINWAKVAGLPDGGRVVFGQTGGGTVFGSNGSSGAKGSNYDLDPGSSLPLEGIAASAFGGVFSIAVATNTFRAFIELLEAQGTVQVLSSPRVATVNNQKAVIKVGQDEYFVTDVSTTTVTGSAAGVSTPNVTLTPFFSGIALDVTPQIDAGGGVTLHIHPSVSEVTDQTKSFTVGGEAQTLPTAQSRVRESDSIVRAQSGQIVVIGGLMQESASDKYASPPGIGRTPVLGSLLSHQQKLASKSELVILLKPLVVESPESWGAAVAQTQGFIDGLMSDRNRGYPSAGNESPSGGGY